MASAGPLSAPLLADSDSSGSHSPLPPSASRTALGASPASGDPPNGSASLARPRGAGRQQLAAAPGTAVAVTSELSWSSALSGAAPIALVNLMQALSQAQMICMGTALDATGVAWMNLLGLVVVQATLLCASSIPRYAIATPDVTVGVLCHGAVSQVYSHSELTDRERAQTALAALGVCTLLQAGCYYALGRMRASELLRYLPYPVVCGLLGLTGLSICILGFGVAGFDSSESWAGLLQSLGARPAHLVPTLAFALSSVGIASTSNSPTAFLLCVPFALLLFYGAAGFNDYSPTQLRDWGWLFDATPQPDQPHTPASLWLSRDLGAVHWRLAMPDRITTLARAVVCLTALVLKVVAVEASAGTPVDSDTELCAAGLANVANAALGGMLANHSALYVSTLRRAGVSDRRVALCAMLITAAILATGPPLMGVFPRFVVGGVLLALGAQMVLDWTWRSRARMDRTGFSVVCAMMAAAIVFGATHAIFLGIVAAVSSSHLRIARLNALKYHQTGATVHAAVSRPSDTQRFLQRHGGAIQLLGLEGFLFEGSTARLLRYALTYIRRAPGEMTFLVLDLAMCQGCDTAACALLGRAARMLSDRSVQLVLCGAQPLLLPTLIAHAVVADDSAASSGAASFGTSALHRRSVGHSAHSYGSGTFGHSGSHGRAAYFETLDGALEWCEDELIMQGSPHSEASSTASRREREQERDRTGTARNLQPRHSALASAQQAAQTTASERKAAADAPGLITQPALFPLPASLAVEVRTVAYWRVPSRPVAYRRATSPCAAASLLPLCRLSAASLPPPLLCSRPCADGHCSPRAHRPHTHHPPSLPSALSAADQRAQLVSPLSCVRHMQMLSPYGTKRAVRVGDTFTSHRSIAKELWVVPSAGMAISVHVEVGGGEEPLYLATLRHGCLLGAEGALLHVPSLVTTRVVSCERGAMVLVIEGQGLSKLLASQPALLQTLMTAHVTLQQDLTTILARRALLWRGGGWRGPSLEPATRPTSPFVSDPLGIPRVSTSPQGEQPDYFA